MTIQTAAVKQYFAHPQALVETEEIGPGTRIWAFAHVLPGARIGAECNICDHAFIETGVVLGNNVTVKNGVAIWQGVTVEENVFLGPNCVLTNDPNPPMPPWEQTQPYYAGLRSGDMPLLVLVQLCSGRFSISPLWSEILHGGLAGCVVAQDACPCLLQQP